MNDDQQIQHEPTRHGKSVVAARLRDAAIRTGKKVTLISGGVDGQIHVCVVQSIVRPR